MISLESQLKKLQLEVVSLSLKVEKSLLYLCSTKRWREGARSTLREELSWEQFLTESNIVESEGILEVANMRYQFNSQCFLGPQTPYLQCLIMNTSSPCTQLSLRTLFDIMYSNIWIQHAHIYELSLCGGQTAILGPSSSAWSLL